MEQSLQRSQNTAERKMEIWVVGGSNTNLGCPLSCKSFILFPSLIIIINNIIAIILIIK